MKKFYLFLILFLSVYTLNAQTPKQLEKISLQLHWKYQFEFAGFIAAKEKGFYQDAGLDVTFKEYEFGIDIPKQVLEGKSEYGIYNSQILIDYLRGKPIKLVSSFFKRASLVLVTQPEIKSLYDLVGKNIMATTKEDFILNFQPYFRHYGIDAGSMSLVPNSYNIDDFASGKVAAMTAFVSDQLYKLDDKNIQYNIFNPSDENIFVLQLELFTSQKEIDEHPKRVLAFKEASQKGWEYALHHKEELAKIIHEKYAPQLDIDDLKKEADGIEKLILPYTYDIGSIDASFLRKQMNIYKNFYNIKSEKSINNFIYQKPKDDKDMFTERELDYIKRHPVIDVCLQYEQFPIDGYADGEMSGIASDIYKLLSKKTSLKFHPIVATSEQNLNKNLSNNRCQLLSIYATNNTSKTMLQPTKPFLHTNFTLVSKLDKAFISDITLLQGKTLVTQFVAIKNYLKHIYPSLTIIVQNDRDKMMKMLLRDKVYGVITINEKADYLIDKYGYAKLKVNAFLAKEHPFEGSIGILKSLPVLHSIIQKSLDTISPKEIYSIVEHWRLNRYQDVTNYKLLFAFFVIVVLIFTIMIYYHNKLKHFNKRLEEEVYNKTKELRILNENLQERVNQKLQELVQKDQILTAQSKKAVMGEMISMIAHQWKQPLANITLQISNLQLDEMMGKEISREHINILLQDINDSIMYLSQTVDDFKTYFHPKRTTNKIFLYEVVGKVVNLAAARIKEEHISVDVNCKENDELNIYTNELVQVMLNILNNAIDAYKEQTTKEKPIIIKCKSIGEMFELTIKDKAGGISDENLKKIFDPYFSTKGKNGTGLGLYMSQMIIEKQFKGTITVQTNSEGTIFKITALKNLH